MLDTPTSSSSASSGLAAAANHLAAPIAPLLQRLGDQAGERLHEGVDAVRDGTKLLRHQALLARDHTTGYIRNEPLKAVAIAAAGGAVLMLLLGLLRGSSSRR
jgi:ElaB/YqjD/DUF883 family membrane-anchored ribosome-binding protein